MTALKECKKNLSKRAEEDKHRRFLSAVPAVWLKTVSASNPPSLPEQPRCIIDLCFYFTPAIPKKGEVLEDSGRLRGDQSVCVGLYVAAVCADGWAWLVFFSFFSSEARRPYTIAGFTAARPLKDLSQCFLLVRRGNFLVNLIKLVMHIFLLTSNKYLKWISVYLVVLPECRTTGVLWGAQRDELCIQQSRLDGGSIRSLFLSTHGTH